MTRLNFGLRRQCQRLLAITAKAWQIKELSAVPAPPHDRPRRLASAGAPLVPVASGLLLAIAY